MLFHKYIKKNFITSGLIDKNHKKNNQKANKITGVDKRKL